MNSIALPTIMEEPEIASESSRRAKKKRLTAVFDFKTFKLDSKMMDREERERMRNWKRRRFLGRTFLGGTPGVINSRNNEELIQEKL